MNDKRAVELRGSDLPNPATGGDWDEIATVARCNKEPDDE
jgi:hypothetical protein